MCGEGFPDFYVQELIKKGTKCFTNEEDKWFSKIAQTFGMCRTMDSYHLRKDENGDPLIEDCKTLHYWFLYSTEEVMTTFDALYNNHMGL